MRFVLPDREFQPGFYYPVLSIGPALLICAPSQQEPWGWQLWGHHLAINCLIIDRQMVLTPCFMGAEICYADQGAHAGLALFSVSTLYSNSNSTG